MESDGRLLPPWNVFCCGGASVYGTSSCCYVESNFICNCPDRNREKFNYTLHYDLLTNAYRNKMHIIEYLQPRQKMEKWDAFVAMLQKSDTIWSTYKRQRGVKYEIKLVSKRHGVGQYTKGFESHPDVTPFDKLVLEIIKDIEKEKLKKESEVSLKVM